MYYMFGRWPVALTCVGGTVEADQLLAPKSCITFLFQRGSFVDYLLHNSTTYVILFHCI